MKISNSSTKTFNECGLKYKLHYKDQLRSKTIGSALFFGGALDKALNELLVSRDLQKAKDIFVESMTNIDYNKRTIYVPTSTIVTYFKSDFDVDLLEQTDYDKFGLISKDLDFNIAQNDMAAFVEHVHNLRKNREVPSETEIKLFSLANYLSMVRKGLLILTTYNDVILPEIKEVISVQEEILLTNSDGDTIVGFIDFVAKMKDDKIYILDNKTSSDFRYYPADCAQKSQQLIVYKHATQHKYHCEGVGYIVLLKKIRRNKTKICMSCGNDGTGRRHAACDKKDCGGKWEETISFSCDSKIILNDIDETLENSIIDMYDNTVQAIKREEFDPNYNSCGAGPIRCQYYDLCHNNDNSNLEKV